jgi:glycosyltransferase involved in cell wall biosynthesis
VTGSNTTSVRIGIHVRAEPQRLRATLESVRATAPAAEVIVMPDGVVSQADPAHAPGAPACFNRLTGSGDADVFIFLESGVLLGPGWLERLLAGLVVDPRNGLAGPSTNHCWNEQVAFPNRADDVAHIAAEAAHRFGTETRTLEPLYSLADFCYVVRREVVEAIGGADERYGTGPCWEMDYNIRAARAGWRGVWVCGAYVHRAPFSPQRRLEEARRFDASKRLYQDKFCGARLCGTKKDYRAHCRGDACPNFAPPALIQVRREPEALATNDLSLAGGSSPEPFVVPALAGSVCPARAEARTTNASASFGTGGDEPPSVSCIMPTYNRRVFVPHAIRYFLRQDYPHTELIVVDDGSDAIGDCLPNDPRIRYLRLNQRLTVGAKRNLACAQARGDIIVHWDDDDWYPPWRLRVQAAALREHNAEVCGSGQLYYFDAAAGRAWGYHYTGRPNTWVAGNTLAYLKSYWHRKPFADVQVGEDTRFVWDGRPRGLCDLANPSLCVAMIHAGNVSPKVTSGAYWRPCSDAPIRHLLGDDLAWYQAATTQAPPLVSCIMPTYNRRSFVPLALAAFDAQDYPHKELLVIDDGSDRIGDLVAGRPGVRYVRLDRRASIGAKRNLACAQAAGAIIAHWDDDDWYASDRLRYQVLPIARGETDITGLENAFVLELPDGVFWTTRAALHQRMFVGDVHGGTLVYRKSLLDAGLRYPDVSLAEDAALLAQALRRGQRLTRLPNRGAFVYVRHGNNAWRWQSGRFLDPAGWQRIMGPDGFTPDLLASYQAATSQVRRAGVG